MSDSNSTLNAPRTTGRRPSYVLVTPAKNEGNYIGQTLKSMVEQTHLPAKWVIVSDGSTDNTEELVRQYASKHDWIELLAMPPRKERHFAGKVLAFNAGFARLKDTEYDVIGNIDGDVAFDNQYFEFLMRKFTENERLGVAGTDFCEEELDKPYDYSVTNVEDVAGACQLFRRRCFEEIGGYVPIKGGGIDSLAVYTARMKGWETKTFTEKRFLHLKKMWGGYGKHTASFFKTGKRDYNLGGHPLWQIFRSIYHMKKKPVFVGGLLILAGYMWELIRNVERPVPAEVAAFVRKEQMQRLKGILGRMLLLRK